MPYKPTHDGRYKVCLNKASNNTLKASIGKTPLEKLDVEAGDYLIVDVVDESTLRVQVE